MPRKRDTRNRSSRQKFKEILERRKRFSSKTLPQTMTPGEGVQSIMKPRPPIQNKQTVNLRNVSVKAGELARKVKTSPLVKMGMKGSDLIGNRVNRYSTAGRISRGVMDKVSKLRMGKAGMGGLIALGFTAITSMGVAKGLMNGAREKVFDRYMQDQRYSRNMLHNSRVGLTSGTSRMNRYGDTMGLSNSLSRTRHGRY